MDDRYNLGRFLEAQNRVYEDAREELRLGSKRGHWMWFVFPQLKGLGHSELARYYAIASIDEAAAYLGHPVLGARLAECTRLVIDAGRTLREIFGYPDDLKFRSSMTLFAHAAPGNSIFKEALEHFGEDYDPLTLEGLK